MKRIRTIAVLPTMFTLGNLVCGFFAIVIAARVDKPAIAPEVLEERQIDESQAREYLRLRAATPEQSGLLTEDPKDPTNLMFSAWLIFLAMVFDALDGYVARKSGTTSDFGAQLDSLCDLVTFGVAPSFLLVKMCPRFAFLHREAVWVIAASFAVCAALRLARFNVESTEDDDHMHFTGLPSPAAAAAIAGFAIMFYTLRKEAPSDGAAVVDNVLQTILPFFAVMLALLMVSRIPYPHVLNQLLRGQRGFSHVVGLVFAVVAVMVVRHYSVPIVCGAFALSGPVRFAWEKVVRRQHQEEPLFD